MIFRDILMFINMLLFLIMGTIMLIQSFLQRGPWTAYAFGVGFLIAGGYRLYLVYKALWTTQPPSVENQ